MGVRQGARACMRVRGGGKEIPVRVCVCERERDMEWVGKGRGTVRENAPSDNRKVCVFLFVFVCRLSRNRTLCYKAVP